MQMAAGVNPVNVSARLSNLTPETTYYVILYAENEDDSAHSSVQHFKTLHASPGVTAAQRRT